MGKELTLGERLAGAARPCQAWDCPTTIPISSDPRKLYCSSQCRHRAAAAIRRTDRSKRAAERERDRVRDSARNRNTQRAEYHRARKSVLAHVEVVRRQEEAARKATAVAEAMIAAAEGGALEKSAVFAAIITESEQARERVQALEAEVAELTGHCVRLAGMARGLATRGRVPLDAAALAYLLVFSPPDEPADLTESAA